MKVCTCFCHALEMCTWFGYNPWINFYHFFYFVNFVIFWHQILRKCIDSGYLISATPYTISCLSLCKFAHLFFHGLKMRMLFGFISAVNFCHISTLLTLSFFAGATSTSPKFDLYCWFCHEAAHLHRKLTELRTYTRFLEGADFCILWSYLEETTHLAQMTFTVTCRYGISSPDCSGGKQGFRLNCSIGDT